MQNTKHTNYKNAEAIRQSNSHDYICDRHKNCFFSFFTSCLRRLNWEANTNFLRVHNILDTQPNCDCHVRRLRSRANDQALFVRMDRKAISPISSLFVTHKTWYSVLPSVHFLARAVSDTTDRLIETIITVLMASFHQVYEIYINTFLIFKLYPTRSRITTGTMGT